MAERAHVTVAQRLALLGLEDRAGDMKNLNVKEGAQVRVSLQDPHYAKRIARLKVNSAADLKRYMGIPAGAVGQDTPVKTQHGRFVSTASGPQFLAFPALPIQDLEMQAHLTSYLFSTTLNEKPTGPEKKMLDTLDHIIAQAGIGIGVLLVQDLHIEENSTLFVSNDIQTLFANAIVIEDSASLRMESPWTRIDCTRIHFVTS